MKNNLRVDIHPFEFFALKWEKFWRFRWLRKGKEILELHFVFKETINPVCNESHNEIIQQACMTVIDELRLMHSRNSDKSTLERTCNEIMKLCFNLNNGWHDNNARYRIFNGWLVFENKPFRIYWSKTGTRPYKLKGGGLVGKWIWGKLKTN